MAAVLKVFAILQALSERNEIGISDLSVRLAMPKATVYLFLQTMKTLAYVRQEVGSERYGLSMKVFELGAKALQYPDMIEIAKPHMRQLSEATGETAWETPARRAQILQGCDFKRFRDNTITTREAFDVELERTLAQGFGQDREEFDDHIRCAAIPIFDRQIQVVAGMSVSFPTFRYDMTREPELVRMLSEASADISRQLGCTAFALGETAKARR